MTRTGRPRALSRATLEEAANELFLEQGYLGTSIDDIANRAGVSRATFFNYFTQKSDLLFAGVDDVIDRLEALLTDGRTLHDAIAALTQSIDLERLPLVAQHAEAMGVVEEARQAGALRIARLTDALAPALDDPVWRGAVASALAHGAMKWARSNRAPKSLAASIDAALQRLHTPPQQVARIDRLD